MPPRLRLLIRRMLPPAWSDSRMSLQSALLGYLLARLIPSISPLTTQENVVLQTTAVATGTMPLAAGFVGIIPALGLLDRGPDGQDPIVLTWASAVGWSCAVAYFGVFLAAPLRKQTASHIQIVKEKLVFPSGTATAQLIAVMHRQLPPKTDTASSLRRRPVPQGYSQLDTDEGVESETQTDGVPEVDEPAELQNGWPLLGWSFVSSGALTLLAYFFPILFSIPLFGRRLASQWLWTFSPSLSYVGQGIIMGFPTTLSMNLGMLVGWAILSPLSKHKGWAPGPVGSMGNGARGWILWVALAVMCAEAVVSLIPVIVEFVGGLRRLWDARKNETDADEDEETETEERLVPTSWVLGGMAATIVLGTIIVWKIFGSSGIKPWATILAFLIGSVLGLLGVRALGETDLNPVSGLGKLAQLAFAFLQPGNVIANIVAGGVAEAGAQQAGDLMQDLKTGHLLGASPRAQFYGQIIGSTLSIFVSATAYQLYAKAYTIPSPAFPAPTAYVWLSLARLLRNGQLPPKSGEFMLWFGVIAAAVAAAKVRAVASDSRWARLDTSAMSHFGRDERDDRHSIPSRPHSRATSISRKSTMSRNQSLIKKNTAPSDLRPSDVLIERFIAWKAITKQLIAYFEGIADIENNTGRELTKLGAVIQVPFRAGNQFLGEGGLQDIFYNIRDKTRAIADQHTSLAKTIDSSLVQHLEKLLMEIKAHIRNIQNDTGKLATNVAKERELSTKCIADLAKSIAMFKNTPMSIQARDDPFCQNLIVTKQLVKQVNEENALQKSIILMQQNSAHFEEGIVRSIQSAWQTFDEWQTRMSASVQETWRTLGSSMASLAPDREWIAFSARSDHLIDPDTPLRNPDTIEYPSKEDPSVVPLHTGMLERKRRYTRAYRESYFVLTAAGFLHEYNSADPVEQTTPSFSLFLPSCTLGPPSSPTTDRSHKFHIEGKKDATGLSRSNSFLHRGHQAWTFRARSHDEMLEWWNDIRMLCARYLVASDQMERSGPVAAAVRQAGYVSEEEVSDHETGSSFEAEEGEGEDLDHQYNGPHHDDEPVPVYSQPQKGSGIPTGSYGYSLDKKVSPGPDSGDGELSRRSSRRMEKAPDHRLDEGEDQVPPVNQTTRQPAVQSNQVAEGDQGSSRPAAKSASSDEAGPAPLEPDTHETPKEEEGKETIMSRFMEMLH
ncbi:hypothetical protein FRC05_011166 [Tulasnella sp. 425]|nr:hypothetical protein FRC05_011166 [Tulasnella sp. 425]